MYREEPRVGEFYRHFKNKMYQIVAVAVHSETGEKLVIYQKLYDDFKVHARPLDMFMSPVDREKYPEVEQKYRFEKVDFESRESVEEKVAESKPAVQEEAEGNPNKDLMEFLNAETYEAKRNVLVGARHRITDRLIDDMAASMDVVVEEKDTQSRYDSLLACITTRAKFEISRKQ